jgi:hypothetical protein
MPIDKLKREPRAHAMQRQMLRPMRRVEIQRAAFLLGIINDADWPSINLVSSMLEARIRDGKIVKRKTGAAQSSPAYYRARKGGRPR